MLVLAILISANVSAETLKKETGFCMTEETLKTMRMASDAKDDQLVMQLYGKYCDFLQAGTAYSVIDDNGTVSMISVMAGDKIKFVYTFTSLLK